MTCDTYSDLIVFYYVKMGLNLIYMSLPIIIIITTMIDLFKIVINGSDEVIHKFWNNLFKRMITILIIFYIPTLMNSFLYFFNIDNYQHCFDIATKETIERMEKQEQAKKELEKKKQEEAERRKAEEKRIKEITEKNKTSRGDNTVYPITGGASGNVSNILEIPYYKQCDSRWGNIQYDTGGATLCSSSCGYTSLAMVAAGLSRNSSINPYTVVKDIRGLNEGEKSRRGYGAATKIELTSSKYLNKYGITATQINKNEILSNLKNGHPIIALVPGHYITLSISANGNIVVLDPYTNWASRAKRSGEFKSINEIQNAYGSINWAAAYSKL